MIHPLKITSTLADETRFQIYEFMLKEKKPYTVQSIADKFSIHPNVARFHLTKLSEIDVITADFMKTGKGGRPGRVYKTTEQGVSLSFPKRDGESLLKWTLELLQELGPEALVKCQNISYKDGYNQMKSLLTTGSYLIQDLSFQQKIELLSSSASLIGYIPSVIDIPSGKKILFTIYNCPFKSYLPSHNDLICSLHETYLKGQMDALFTQNEFVQLESMVHNCENCNYEIKVNNI